jgi:ribonuclease BN (tRNA processing enzyme)
MCLESLNGGGKIVYGADSRPTEDLKELARGCDLLIVEATLPRPERSGQRGHLTPREAGEHAREAGVKKVMITHFSDELGDAWMETEASAGFGAPVELAREGAVFEV